MDLITVNDPAEIEPTIDRYEVERAFSELLDYGDITAVAEELGRSVTLVSQWFNPNNERTNPLYKSICILVAIVRANRKKGVEAVRLFIHYCGQHVQMQLSDSAVELRKRLVTKWENFITGEMEMWPTEKQISALEQLISEAQRLVTSKRDSLRRSRAKQATLQKFGPLRPVGK